MVEKEKVEEMYRDASAKAKTLDHYFSLKLSDEQSAFTLGISQPTLKPTSLSFA